MRRRITGFHCDDAGDWVAELDCAHGQHVRHRPPFQLRAWVLHAEGRRAHLDTPIDCPLCERAELPESLRPVATTPELTEETLPRDLLGSHRLPDGRWGLLEVHEGTVRLRAETSPALDVVVAASGRQAIPPTVPFRLELLGSVRLTLTWFERDPRP